MIEQIVVKNYRKFRDLELAFHHDLNVIVGDNDSGKSTLLECINLALNFKINGRNASGELNSFLFNKRVIDEYVAGMATDRATPLPEILVELYLKPDPSVARLVGSVNSKSSDQPGLRVHIRFNNLFQEDYEAMIADGKRMTSVPIEYYEAKWFSFADKEIPSSRFSPVKSVVLDATSARVQSGADAYVRSVISENLNPQQKAALAVAFRGLRETFFAADEIKAINEALESQKQGATDKKFEVSMDVSQRNTWESHIVPHLDSIPLYFAGMGEQNCLKLLLSLKREDAPIVLVEEIENHLSFTTMAWLLKSLRDSCEDRQLIVTTHSAYVLNKLGLDNLILLGGNGTTTKLTDLPTDTKEYFEKLPGYDTLRMILAKRAILVEGPSDELVVQRAYYDLHGGRLPVEDKIDVISVEALAFKRFLEIAKRLGTDVSVVTDNDGDYEGNVTRKYAEFAGHDNIRIHSSPDESNPSLEQQISAVNAPAVLGRIMGREFANADEAASYMGRKGNKTNSALKIFGSDESITFPDYIVDAVR